MRAVDFLASGLSRHGGDCTCRSCVALAERVNRLRIRELCDNNELQRDVLTVHATRHGRTFTVLW